MVLFFHPIRMPQAEAPLTSRSSAYLSALTSDIEKKLQRVSSRGSCFEISLLILRWLLRKCMKVERKRGGVFN